MSLSLRLPTPDVVVAAHGHSDSSAFFIYARVVHGGGDVAWRGDEALNVILSVICLPPLLKIAFRKYHGISQFEFAAINYFIQRIELCVDVNRLGTIGLGMP